MPDRMKSILFGEPVKGSSYACTQKFIVWVGR